MEDPDWLAARFEAHCAHLRAMAYRMLGSVAEAIEILADPGRLGQLDLTTLDA